MDSVCTPPGIINNTNCSDLVYQDTCMVTYGADDPVIVEMTCLIRSPAFQLDLYVLQLLRNGYNDQE